MAIIKGHYAECLPFVLPSTLYYPTGFSVFKEISRICTPSVRSSQEQPVLYSLPALGPFPPLRTPNLSYPVRDCALPVRTGLTVSRAAHPERPSLRSRVLAAPASPCAQAAPGPRRTDSLPRRLQRPRRARPSARAGWCSLSLSAAARPPRAQPLLPGRRRLSAGSATPRTATASLQSPHDAGHC